MKLRGAAPNSDGAFSDTALMIAIATMCAEEKKWRRR
jgi:hypothetical protein